MCVCVCVYSCLGVLVLSENPVGEKGVRALGQALEHNTTLTSLVLGQGAAKERGTWSPVTKNSRSPRKREIR